MILIKNICKIPKRIWRFNIILNCEKTKPLDRIKKENNGTSISSKNSKINILFLILKFKTNYSKLFQLKFRLGFVQLYNYTIFLKKCLLTMKYVSLGLTLKQCDIYFMHS